MNLSSLLITDTADFKSRRLEVEKLFHCNATLPDQVFREGIDAFAFENFDLMLRDSFWPVVQELAEVSDDDSVLISVLDPDPSSFWKKHYGHYGSANIPVSISSCEFSDVLNKDSDKESPPGGLQLYANTVILVPQSAKWAIWGQRRWETCVVGFRDEVPTGSLNGLRWALDIYLTYCFKYFTVPPDFAETFRSNYCNSDLDDCPLHLVIGGIDLVKGNVPYADVAMLRVSKELEPELERTRFLDDAPFKVIRLTIRFGTQWGEPDFTPIDKRYSELGVDIEMPMSRVRFMGVNRVEHVIKKATLQVMVAVAQKYGLDGHSWEEQLASLTPPPELSPRSKERSGK